MEERSRMAKGKRAQALFEVMSKGRLAGGKSAPTPGAGIPTPKWWFNSKNRSGTKVIPPQETAEHVDDDIEEPDPAIESPEMAPQLKPSAMDDAGTSYDASSRPQPVALTVD